MKNEKNITARIGELFNEELESIKNERLRNGMDKKKKSTKKLTNLIIRHDSWAQLKEDMINLSTEEDND